jgi:ABC-type methionine transport system ATPase subunit
MGIKRKVYLTFPSKQTTEAIICDMYDKFKVRFNIRSASVNEHLGLMAVELEHDSAEQIVQAMDFFKSRGLTVEPIEMDVISG